MARRSIDPPKLKRGAAKLTPNRKITIVLEGKNTEPEYIDSFARQMKNGMVKIAKYPAAGVPLSLVKQAIELKRQNARGMDSYGKDDEFWVVFDRDTHPHIPDAIDRARNSQIFFAYSNPCFELWTLLHIQDYDGPIGHHEMQKLFQSKCPGYKADKGKHANFGTIESGYSDACNRARQMRERRLKEGAEMEAPFTNFDLLTLSISQSLSQRRKSLVQAGCNGASG